ncbi:helix-turn-helix domain-containing protein [Streptomyces sp. SID2999]|nr:helix-turn-helix domain-containing protein [Streptomyces sp. SID2999]
MPDGGLKSVTSALEVLDCFETQQELGITDIARKLGVAKSTAHRLVTSLRAKGYVERNEDTGCYCLGLKLHELGRLAAERSRLRRTALPLLESLRVRTGYTVHLAVPDGPDVIYLERLHSHQGLMMLHGVAHRQPVHLTASGKAIAAFDATVAQARRDAGFPRRTAASITDRRQYDAALDRVRHQGYAVNDQETVDGLTTVAAPVRDRTGRARAAISVVAPTSALAGVVTGQARLVSAVAQRLAGGLCL